LLLIAIAVTAIMPAPGANPSWSSDAAKFYQVADADYITPFFVSPVSVRVLNLEAAQFIGFVGYDTLYARIAGPAGVRLLPAVRYVGNIFRVAGIKCLLKASGIPPKGVFISESLWENEYERSSDVLSRSITVANRAYPIAGVVKSPEGLFDETELWIPLERNIHTDESVCFRILARLKLGIESEQAQAEIKRVLEDFGEEYRFLNGNNLKITPVDDVFRPKYVPEETFAAVARKALVHKS